MVRSYASGALGRPGVTAATLAVLARTVRSGVESPAACADFAEIFPQIEADFAHAVARGPITAALLKELRAKVLEYDAHAYYFLEVAIFKGEIYVSPRHLGPWLRATMQLIERAVEKYAGWIHDVHFFFSVLDEAYLERGAGAALPLLSSITTRGHWDIPVPAQAYFDEGGISSSGHSSEVSRWESEAFQDDLARAYPWEGRQERAFFRGHDWESSNSLIESMASRPEEPCISQWSVSSAFGYRRWYEELSAPGGDLESIMDVGLTGAPDYSLSKRKGRSFAKPVKIPEHGAHKYLLHLDGTSHSSRLVKLLTVGSVVLKQDSPYEEWFYRNLKPYEHFVPISRDRCSYANLSDSLAWLRENDDAARRIANAGQRLQRILFSTEAATCYWQRILAVYGSFQELDVREAISSAGLLKWQSRTRSEL